MEMDIYTNTPQIKHTLELTEGEIYWILSALDNDISTNRTNINEIRELIKLHDKLKEMVE